MYVVTSKQRARRRLDHVMTPVKMHLARGRKCQLLAVHTNNHDVIEQLEGLFRNERIRAATLLALD